MRIARREPPRGDESFAVTMRFAPSLASRATSRRGGASFDGSALATNAEPRRDHHGIGASRRSVKPPAWATEVGSGAPYGCAHHCAVPARASVTRARLSALGESMSYAGTNIAI